MAGRSMPGSPGSLGPPGEEEAVYVISVAAQLSGLHPQTLRTYERVGLITPGRTGGGGRRYSYRDIERLREIAHLTASGIGIEGVKRILDLENAVTALRARNAELVAELEATRDALRQAVAARPAAPRSNLPALPGASVGQSVVVWRRSP
ncbi:heat shock protein transcriptional repressor HspR [Nocardioides daeguensis]|uniref:MerR family transcriptional regulator n=1 Tax=Nocardioides daeguensis TaxID=908359 RepID=A0ABP6VA54_9ACTN|nr:MerR family transcriptional regulator [Nocardioides daeguensis]